MPKASFIDNLQATYDLWLAENPYDSKSLAPLIVLLDEDETTPADELFLRSIAVMVVARVASSVVDALDRGLLLDAINKKDRWLSFRDVGGEPHAFVRLIISQFSSMDRSSAGEDRMIATVRVASEWSGVSALDPWRGPDRCPEVFCRGLFGDWWWELRRPDQDDLTIALIVERERPPFLQGRLLGASNDDAHALPDLNDAADFS